jgi:hypothetical protein
MSGVTLLADVELSLAFMTSVLEPEEPVVVNCSVLSRTNKLWTAGGKKEEKNCFVR